MRMLELTMAGNDVARFCGDLGPAMGCLSVPQAVLLNDNDIRARALSPQKLAVPLGTTMV